MANDSFVSVVVDVKDVSIEIENFGLPLVLAYHTAWLDRVRQYADSSEAIDDGFEEGDPVVAMIDAIKAQNPAPPLVAVGRRANAYTKKFTLSPVEITEGFVYSFVIRKVAGSASASTTVTYTVPASATTTTVATEIAASIEAIYGVTAAATTGTITVTADTAGVLWAIDRESKETQEALHLEDITVDPGIAADLAAVREALPSFYGLAIDSAGKAEVLAAAAKVATWKNCIYIPETCDYSVEAATAGNTLLSLVNLAYRNVARPIYHRTSTVSYPACRMFGKVFTRDPGAIQWAHKTLAGMPADPLGSTAIANIKASEGVCYVSITNSIAGTHGEWAWKSCSGEWMDVIRGVDWFIAQAKADQLAVILGNDKVPFNDSGINLFAGALKGTLAAASVNVFNSDHTVSIPKASTFTSAQRNARKLYNLNFSGTLQGAITAVDVKGTVTH